MNKLHIKLNGEFKSFSVGFEATIEGDLVILSGVNGSGKSQLLDLISRETRRNKGGDIIADSVIKLNEINIPKSKIIHKTFKDSIVISEFQIYGSANSTQSISHVNSHYQRCLLNINDNYLVNYGQKSTEAKMKMIEAYGQSKFDSKNITEDEIRSALVGFEWTTDDIFTNQIQQIFYSYCKKERSRQLNAGKNEGGFISNNSDAPWTHLNQLLQELKIDYKVNDEYVVSEADDSLAPMIILKDTSTREERQLSDLSDGERALISLAFSSLYGIDSDNLSIVLLDEFDATFNPSLTKAFYEIIKKYYLEKGIMVIIATHSIATISMAPENANFYEVFKSGAPGERIKTIDSLDEYGEAKIANKKLYEEIENQEARANKLDSKNLRLRNLLNSSDKPILYVEDTYDYIYKVAYLKLKNVEFTKDNIESIFDENADFVIARGESAGGVAGFLSMKNTDLFSARKIVGLFDYDKTGSECFYLMKNQKNWDDSIQGNAIEGWFKKRNQHAGFYALLLPASERFSDVVANISDANFNSHVEVENYLDQIELLEDQFTKQTITGTLTYDKVKEVKDSFWKKIIDLPTGDFSEFELLFVRVHSFLGLSNFEPVNDHLADVSEMI